MQDAWIADRFAQAIKAVPQVTHEAVAVAHHLRTPQALEAAHTPRAPFQMLVIALDPLLFRLAREVLRLRHDGPERRWIGRRLVRRDAVTITPKEAA
jgi:hypothetical protein